MFEHKPISTLPGVVTYRCACPHPTRNELSMFYTDVKRQADDYARLGWTVTPLGRITEPVTVGISGDGTGQTLPPVRQQERDWPGIRAAQQERLIGLFTLLVEHGCTESSDENMSTACFYCLEQQDEYDVREEDMKHDPSCNFAAAKALLAELRQS